MMVIMSLVLVRFVMACVFSWFMSARLVETPKNLSKTGISPAVMPRRREQQRRQQARRGSLDEEQAAQ